MQNKKPLIAILANDDVDIYNFRKELIEEINSCGYDILISCPFGDKLTRLSHIPFHYDNPVIDRRGTNIIADINLFKHYCSLLKEYKPDVVLSYTIKPNVYAGLACQKLKIPYISNITGLGTSIMNGGILSAISLFLYRIGLRKSNCVFFQNETNAKIMREKKVVKDNYCLVPGSGVDIKVHQFEGYPDKNAPIEFVTIGRIMRDKGINELIEVAYKIKKDYPDTVFKLIGDFDEEEYKEIVQKAVDDGVLNYLGVLPDVHPELKKSHAIIHASYHEGMANVLLEAAATGRPVIASDVPGCRETFDDGLTGYSCKVKDADSLAEAIEKFINTPYDKQIEMGKLGREKMEKEFDRQIVVSKYIEVINQILEENKNVK
ncbi:MAG: glycosyltransferase family 4 protein [Eubacterium sp.]|nr:glycosyltransferase family 4 protein [Eubacterium sp.]